MQVLSQDNLTSLPSDLQISPKLLSLPEKVLQFGTGVLLRGLPDYFIEKANRAGEFNGRIVVVKSTDGGDADAFRRQDSLYTLSVRGIEEGKQVEKDLVISAISRVLLARSQWEEILKVAVSPDLAVVISNTTEVGIQLVEESIEQSPPDSFPAKLLAVLYARFQAFDGAADKGLVIVPTELIPDNATKLLGILQKLAEYNKLDAAFQQWLTTANTFCNSLVDRIVPGSPPADEQAKLTRRLGREDELSVMAEAYRLWAIQGDEKVREVLSFHRVDPGVIIEPDIDIYRELKLRLLNGTHTLSCGLAVLAHCPTVRAAMEDSRLSAFIAGLMLSDIAPAIPYAVPMEQAETFGRAVLDRFSNPFIEHRWINITLQYSSKLRMRVLPVLLRHYERNETPPPYIALGFAAYLQFLHPVEQRDGKYYGRLGDEAYPIQDDQAAYFHELWLSTDAEDVPRKVLSNTDLWGHDLTQLPGFEAAVSEYFQAIDAKGAAATLAKFVGTVRFA